jgi:ferric-dicitrate binding protein FerR (iron transport regulator)
VVALNSNSKLVFPKQFTGNTREVTIYGEAFFDVKPNREKPFIITAGNAQVKVVGTSFNVCAYPENETVEVVVKTGKVQVTNKIGEVLSDANQVYLVPGEKGTLFIKSSILEKSQNSNPNYLAWKTRDFVFNDIPLDEVFQCLEKTYHVKIQVTDPELNALKLNAQFDKKPIDFILNVVGLTFNLELSVENEQYTFSSHKNN